MKRIIPALTLLFLSSYIAFSQSDREYYKLEQSYLSEEMIEVPSIASMIANGTFIEAVDVVKEVNPKRTDGNRVVPGKGLPIGNDPLMHKDKSFMKNPTKGPIVNWVAATSGSTPTDPTGAVGRDHYMNSWNSSFRVWDKEGNNLTPPASLANIWPGEDLGDPIVFYDKFADRFVITQFSDTPNGFLVAVCKGSDPVNDGWYTYRFNTNSFPDYPKYSVWSDGYYITANKNSFSASTSQVVYALNRDKLIDGDNTAEMVGFSLPGIDTNGFFSPLGFNANGDELPPAGDAPIVYMQDNAWAGVSSDHLKIWNINVDWENTGNSTISSPQIISTEVFKGVFNGGSFSNLPQPSGPDIDALQATIMYMAQYRRFPTYNTVVFNFVVDLENQSDHAGVRWYELRQDNDGDDWYIYQEGTYEQPDGHSAFCASMAMDALGNIGMAYSVVSETKSVSIMYTGRFSGDDLDQMTVIEDTIWDGSDNNSNVRYGDYAQLTIDPIDDKTFWHIAEHFTPARRNRVAAFKISPDLNLDAGIIEINSPANATLSADQEVNVTVRNFGTDPISDFSIAYQIDDNPLVVETISESIPAMSNVTYTFSETSDMSVLGQAYDIKVYTDLSGDEDMLNDTMTANVTHLPANDIGIHSIENPLSGEELTDNESVKVNIRNYGGVEQNNFSVTFSANGIDPLTEVVEGPLEVGQTMEYVFTEAADLSEIGEYDFNVYTSLAGDIDQSNDTSTALIENFLCQPESNCTDGDGFKFFELSTISNSSGCSPNGYADYTDQVANITPGETYDLTMTTHHGNQKVKIWIDFNDNLEFEEEEIIIDNYEIADGEQEGVWTETTDFVVPPDAEIGLHRMRAKSSRNISVPSNPCTGSYRGETEDYTVLVDNAFSVNENDLESNDLQINSLPNNRFEVLFDAQSTQDVLIISLYNAVGQQLVYNRVNGDNGHYYYDLDMSYAPKGVYFVRLGNTEFSKVKKIVVQ